MELGTKEFNNLAMEMFGGKPKQQTAVEWLAEQVNSKNFTYYGDFFKLVEQAKEMEKQQQEQDRNVYLNAYVDGSRAQAKLMYNEEDLECAWSSSEQNMRFQFSSSAYKGITFKQWLEKFKEEISDER